MPPSAQLFPRYVVSPPNSPPEKLLEVEPITSTAHSLALAEGEVPSDLAYTPPRMLRKLSRPGTEHLSLTISKSISSLTAAQASIDAGLDSEVTSQTTHITPPSAPSGLQDKSIRTLFSSGGDLTPEVSSLPARPVFPSPIQQETCPDLPIPVVPDTTRSVGSQCDSFCSDSQSKLIPGTCISLQDCGSVTYAFDLSTQEHFICKVFNLQEYHERLRPYFFLDYELALLQLVKVIEDPTSRKAFALFEINEGGDLHSYIRQKKRLREDEARQLLEPIFKTIAECHNSNFLVRQLKLRHCVFLDHTRTQLVLHGLEDGKTLAEESDDVIYDRSGCPAYVSPEVVSHVSGYSGRAADVWAAGVVLYTALIGKYPFQTSSTSSLLAQVRQAKYTLPSWLSLPVRDLLSSMLCRDPEQRIDMDTALAHPWFKRKVKTTPRPVPVGLARPAAPSKHRKSKLPSPPSDGLLDTDMEVPDSQEAFFAQSSL